MALTNRKTVVFNKMQTKKELIEYSASVIIVSLNKLLPTPKIITF